MALQDLLVTDLAAAEAQVATPLTVVRVALMET
jgi:hypothetical protein